MLNVLGVEYWWDFQMHSRFCRFWHTSDCGTFLTSNRPKCISNIWNIPNYGWMKKKKKRKKNRNENTTGYVLIKQAREMQTIYIRFFLSLHPVYSGICVYVIVAYTKITNYYKGHRFAFVLFWIVDTRKSGNEWQKCFRLHWRHKSANGEKKYYVWMDAVKCSIYSIRSALHLKNKRRIHDSNWEVSTWIEHW